MAIDHKCDLCDKSMASFERVIINDMRRVMPIDICADCWDLMTEESPRAHAISETIKKQLQEEQDRRQAEAEANAAAEGTENPPPPNQITAPYPVALPES